MALVFWEGYLGVAPSLINAARTLAQRGFHVDIITRRAADDFAPPPELGPAVQVLTSEVAPLGPDASNLRKRMEFLLTRLKFLLFAVRSARGRRYELVIGVDIDGLMTAFPLSLLKRTDLAHWSLEIHPLPAGRRWWSRLSRWLRLRCYRAPIVTIAQDGHRAEALVSLCGIDPKTIFRIPNGPTGVPVRGRATLLQGRLGLAPDQKVALHIGMLSETVMSRQLATNAAGWPKGWLLVFHERQRRNSEDPYLREVQAAGGERLAMSLDPVSYDELDELVASAHVGILLYDVRVGLNYSMPGSSGKLGQYLKCGLPVVALDLPGLPEVIDHFGCGICVPHVEDFGDALAEIDRDWQRFHDNAIRCYEEMFEFSKQFDNLLNALPSLR